MSKMIQNDLIKFGFALYAEGAAKTVIYPDQYKVIYPALKLAGEAGEVAQKIGKQIRDCQADFDDPGFRQAVKKELGGVLWYIAAVARDLDISLDDVALTNLEQLASRAKRGVLGGSGDNR